MPTNRPKRDFSPYIQKTLAIVNGVSFLPRTTQQLQVSHHVAHICHPITMD